MDTKLDTVVMVPTVVGMVRTVDMAAGMVVTVVLPHLPTLHLPLSHLHDMVDMVDMDPLCLHLHPSTPLHTVMVDSTKEGGPQDMPHPLMPTQAMVLVHMFVLLVPTVDTTPSAHLGAVCSNPTTSWAPLMPPQRTHFQATQPSLSLHMAHLLVVIQQL